MRLVLFCVFALLAGCASAPVAVVAAPDRPVISAAPTEVSTPTPIPPPPPKKAAAKVDVGGAVRSVAKSADVGALVLDRETGAELLALDADRPFHSASLVKLLIALDVLHSGADAATRQRVERMLRLSDDAVASALWTRRGGGALVRRTASRLGLTGTRPPADPGRWGDTLLSARDVGRVYTHVMGLPAADRALIVDALAAAPRVAADGFDQHFGIPSGIEADWAVKQGWGNNAKVDFVHSTGLVGRHWRYIVVLLTEHPPSTRTPTATASVTAGATALARLVSETED